MQNVATSGVPEKINSFNIDYQNILGPVSTKISLFRNDVFDLIDTKKVQPYETYNYAIIYENSGGMNIAGGELEIKVKPVSYLQLFANASYQNIDYKTEINGQKLSVPEIKGNIGGFLNFRFGLYADAVLHYTGNKEAQYAYIYQLPDNSVQNYFMKIPAVATFDLNLGYRLHFSWGEINPSIKSYNLFNTRNIQYAIFDSSRGYFGLDTPARNYTEEMKREFENRNALNDRKIIISLKFKFY
jgi:outer membrane receptor for ferrienterochelin and colicin